MQMSPMLTNHAKIPDKFIAHFLRDKHHVGQMIVDPSSFKKVKIYRKCNVYQYNHNGQELNADLSPSNNI